MSIGLAFRLFWAAIWNRKLAERLRAVLEAEQVPENLPKSPPGAEPPSPQPTRNEALALLAALQREARFLDLVQESLDPCTDAEIGAAARDVLTRCRATLDRFFGIQPLAGDEGQAIEIPSGYDPFRYRLVGSVSGSGPYRGRIVHPGWKATRCQLPEWSGAPDAAWILAPTEVQIF